MTLTFRKCKVTVRAQTVPVNEFRKICQYFLFMHCAVMIRARWLTFWRPCSLNLHNWKEQVMCSFIVSYLIVSTKHTTKDSIGHQWHR